jgi:hypothetical protein
MRGWERIWPSVEDYVRVKRSPRTALKVTQGLGGY